LILCGRGAEAALAADRPEGLLDDVAARRRSEAAD
jgi:hypothetical protein